MSMFSDFKLLEKHGFKLIPYRFATSEKESVEMANELKYPVAMKVISDEISHKTDVGGVKINLKNSISVKSAFNEIMSNTKRFNVKGVLIQKMSRKGVELIVGGKKDVQFGHMIVLGLGGIYVEVFKDITARICPINSSDVIEMVYELKSHPILVGTRGKKAINLSSLTSLLIKTCKFMEQENISEIDLNPVVFNSRGCDIVDVRFSKDETKNKKS